MTIEFAPTRIQPAPLHVTSDQLVRVVQEYELQTAVMGGQHAKAEYGIRLILDLHKKAALAASEAFQLMVALDTTAEYSPPYDAIWRQWIREFVEQLLNIVANAARIGAKVTFQEIERTLYIPPEPPRQQGLLWQLWQLLFGKG